MSNEFLKIKLSEVDDWIRSGGAAEERSEKENKKN